MFQKDTMPAKLFIPICLFMVEKVLLIMVDNFEKETAPLTEYEERTLLQIMVKCLNRHRGKEQAISNRKMIEGLEGYGYVVGGSARIRKLINYIRVNGLVECLMATSNGYYITDDPWEKKRYIESLQGREDAIRAVKAAMREQLNLMKNRKDEDS